MDDTKLKEYLNDGSPNEALSLWSRFFGFWSRFFGFLFFFFGKAFFAYLPLAVYVILNLRVEDWTLGESTSLIFLSLGFVFIAQINNPFYAFNMLNAVHKKIKEPLFFLYATKIFCGICSLTIYASDKNTTGWLAWILFAISLITLLFSTYFDKIREGSIENMKRETREKDPYSPPVSSQY